MIFRERYSIKFLIAWTASFGTLGTIFIQKRIYRAIPEDASVSLLIVPAAIELRIRRRLVARPRAGPGFELRGAAK